MKCIFTVFAFLWTFFAVSAQSTGENFRVLDGAGNKESIGTNWNGHYYIIKLVNDKVTGLCVDNKIIADSNFSRYSSLVNRIVTQVRQDEAQGERDREQGARDREQAERDQIQAGRDREQADRDREQAERDRIQASHDREQAERDRAQAERDRQQAAEDRENLRKLTALLVDKKLIPDAASLKDLVLTEDELVVNGKKASPEIHQEIKQQFSKWAHGGFSYGRNNCCTSIHIHTN